MSTIAITVASHDHPYLQALKRSAEKVGMPFHAIMAHWQGFGTKIIALREYLKILEGYTHFIFVDAYDTLFLRPFPAPPLADIVFSTEKHRWPDSDAPYPFEYSADNPWSYLNSGAYVAKISTWCAMVDRNPVNYIDDDQRYFTQLYLKGEPIALDQGCHLFQSYAFEHPGDFLIKGGQFYNAIHTTLPSIIHFNGKCHDQKIYRMQELQSLAEAKAAWKQSIEGHQQMHEKFISLVNDDNALKDHRDYVETPPVKGFGERSFLWMWHLIIKEMPKQFTFLEIGVHKAQILSLIELLAKRQKKKAKRYGITPLDGTGTGWTEDDYKAGIEDMHDHFGLKKDYTIFKGLSEDPEIIAQTRSISAEIVFIDGGHSEHHVINDITHYAPLVKQGGYLVIDDCCNNFAQPWGYFCGIDIVTKVVERMLPYTGNDQFEFLFSVVHNRVYMRK